MMKLDCIRLSNFQSFGGISKISFEDTTFLIGPNGSGKTAVLQALCRLFAFNPALRRIIKSDFHVPSNEKETPETRNLWIEVDFIFPEVATETESSSVPQFFKHMRLEDPNDFPRVRFRLSATLNIDGDIEESLDFVIGVDSNGEPTLLEKVPSYDRNLIHIHYIPARRDPGSLIAYGTNALLGRLLRSVNWTKEQKEIQSLIEKINTNLLSNSSITVMGAILQASWKKLHKGKYLIDPQVTFGSTEIDTLLRHLSISFVPGHDESQVDFSQLSDGQKSLLYLTIVLAFQNISCDVRKGITDAFELKKLHPAEFTLIALEEPENSLSPHYLGRIIDALNAVIPKGNAQAIIATHAPSILRRIKPEQIRYLRLNKDRSTVVSCIKLPEKTSEAHKFVRQAVQAYPEIYFGRLVILGEGDSEAIVLPRLLQAEGISIDSVGITIAPLGGRHVNYFWRLLSELNIPYITLLDLDTGRYQGGWGRVNYVNDQLRNIDSTQCFPKEKHLYESHSSDGSVRDHQEYFEWLRGKRIFFSDPLDLDFSMIRCYPTAYGVSKEDLIDPDCSVIKSVLGKSQKEACEYTDNEQRLFCSYHRLFKIGSKPSAHIQALSQLSDDQLLENMPESIKQLAQAATKILEELPE